jgi:hypothetical protein
MKTFALYVLIVLAALGLGAAAQPARAQNYSMPAFAYAWSPDRPKTWVDGAMRAHQSLHWSDDKHMLVANVTYSTADYADNTHPTEENEYTLTFPTVHFDASSGKFTAGGVTVGHLKNGFFGTHVVLEPNVQLSIHRHHGVIVGALIPATADD